MNDPDEHQLSLPTNERLQAIRARLTGIGYDAEVEELFAYIDELDHLTQDYERSLAPELEGLTWARRNAERVGQHDR